MERAIIEAKVFAIFEDIFDVAGMKLSLGLQRTDVEDWDSMGHVRLILAIEEEFKVPVLYEKAAELTSIESIVQYLTNALAK